MQEQVQSSQSQRSRLYDNNQNIQISIFQDDDDKLSDSFVHRQGGYALYCSFDEKFIYIVLVHDGEENCEGIYYFKKSKRNLRKIKQYYWMKRLAHLQQLKFSQGVIIAIQTNMTYKLFLKRHVFQTQQKLVQPYLKTVYNIHMKKVQKMNSKLLVLLMSLSLKSSLMNYVEKNLSEIKKTYQDLKYQQEKNLTKCAVCLEVLQFKPQKQEKITSQQILQEDNNRYWNYLIKKVLKAEDKSYCCFSNSNQNAFKFYQEQKKILLPQKQQIESEQSQDNDLKHLICSHVFHKQCIEKWLQVKNYCPVCKTRQAKTQIKTRQYQWQENFNQFEFIEFNDIEFDQELFMEQFPEPELIWQEGYTINMQRNIYFQEEISNIYSSSRFNQSLQSIREINPIRPLANMRRQHYFGSNEADNLPLRPRRLREQENQQEHPIFRNRLQRIQQYKQKRRKKIEKFKASNRRSLRSHDRKNLQTNLNTSASQLRTNTNQKRSLKKKKINKNVNKRQLQKKRLDFNFENKRQSSPKTRSITQQQHLDQNIILRSQRLRNQKKQKTQMKSQRF